MGLTFVIQSLKPPVYLEERVESFVTSFREKLVGLSAEDFEAQKDALVLMLLEAPKNLREENGRFWHQIDQGYNDFTRGTPIDHA